MVKLPKKLDYGISLNFLRAGLYNRSNGYIGARITDDYWWSNTSGAPTLGRLLATYPKGVGRQDGNYRGYGFAVRCVVREG